jgi:hypothetical protein
VYTLAVAAVEEEVFDPNHVVFSGENDGDDEDGIDSGAPGDEDTDKHRWRRGIYHGLAWASPYTLQSRTVTAHHQQHMRDKHQPTLCCTSCDSLLN